MHAGIEALEDASRWILAHYGNDPRTVLAGAGPFLELAGIVLGGAQLARAALIAARNLGNGNGSGSSNGDAAFMRAKIATARHFADHCLTLAPALRDTVVDGAAGVLALADEEL